MYPLRTHFVLSARTLFVPSLHSLRTPLVLSSLRVVVESGWSLYYCCLHANHMANGQQLESYQVCRSYVRQYSLL